MPLPSSHPSNRVSVGVAGPQINLAAYTANPAATQEALIRGIQTGNALSDAVILRPAQIDAARKQALLASGQADAGLRLVSAEEAGRRGQIDAGNAVNSLTAEDAKAKQDELLNPGRALRVAEAQVTAIKDDYDQAKQGIVDAHAEGDPKKIETAEKKAAKLAGDLDLYTSRYKRLIADTTAAQHNAEAGATKAKLESALATGDLRTAPQLVETRQYQTAVANKQAEENAIRAADFQASDARVAAGTNADIIAGGQSQVAAAPFKSEPVLRSLEDAAKTQAVTSSLAAKAGLLTLVQQIATGSFTGAVSPEQDKSIRDAAQAAGVPVLLPNGAKRPLGEISAEFSKRVNVKDAEKEVTAIRETAAANQSALTALQQIKGLGQVNTGALYTVPGAQSLDRVFAQFGADQSQKREMYSALNQRLVPLVRQPGSVSNFEQQLYIKALPGPGLSEKSNAAMLQGLLAVGERNAQRPAFYDALLGPLPVGEVNKLWGQYTDQNPSILDENATANKHAISPAQYVKFLTADPASADNLVRQLAAGVDISSLRPGSSAADVEAAPGTDPFLAGKGARGETIPVPNPKYWNPLIQAAASVRRQTSAAAPAQANPGIMGAIDRPAEDFLRPAPAGSASLPSLDALVPRR